MTAVATPTPTTSYFAVPRHRSAIALLLGAAAMLGLVQTSQIRFYYTPLIIGLTYLIAAAVAGRRGALWAPGIITSLWGVAVLLGVHRVTSGSKGTYEIAGAIGIVLALVLRYAVGLAAGFVGMAVAYAIILVHDNAHLPSWIFKGATFAVLLGVWGLWELRPGPRPLADVDRTGSRPDAIPAQDGAATPAQV